MKKHLKFVFLAPLFMAVLCDPNEDACSLEDFETYIINVENIAETYTKDETIWLNAQTSATLIDNCTETDEPELIEDAREFLDGLFILKLNNTSELNAKVFTDMTVNYNIGEPNSFSTCSQTISYLPKLSEDKLFYQYRIGVSINTPGDYCIVNGWNSTFKLDNENNAQIFDIYNTLDNQIKFESCSITFTRNGTDGYYFFRVE